MAILKHGLYEIDVIINRAIMYGLLVGGVTAIYVLIVVGIGTTAGYAGGPLLNAAAALAIAVLFQPLRRRAQLLANRIVYGRAGHALPGAVRFCAGHGGPAGR